MTINDKLNYLKNTKSMIKSAIIDKGVDVPEGTPFREYANKINEISGGGKDESYWQPDPEWFDIKTILEQDTRDYAGKAIFLLPDDADFNKITMSSSGHTAAIATSDGVFKERTSSNETYTHTWDRSKDKPSSDSGIKTRYIIYYFDSSTVQDSYSDYYTTLKTFCIYAIFGVNPHKGTGSFSSGTFFRANKVLQSFDFLEGFNFDFEGSAEYFGADCYVLKKLPENLDFSNVTNMRFFCSNAYSLEKLPDNMINTNSVTSFQSFCSNCHSLRRLSPTLDTSSGTSFSSFCYYCVSLTEIPDNIDTSNGTDFSAFCSTCYSLKEIPDNIDTSNGTRFNSFCYNCYSLTSVGSGFSTPNLSGSMSYILYTCSSLKNVKSVLNLTTCTNLSILQNCPALVNFKIILPPLTSNVTNFKDAYNISVESFKFMADNAPVTSGAKMAVGMDLFNKCGGADGYIATKFAEKGWTFATT